MNGHDDDDGIDPALAGGDFKLFVTRLGIQALIALGVIENPVTGEKVENEVQARMLEADLGMLLRKTEGNLEPDEADKLREVLSSMRERLSR
ncbi:hypothetical protein Pla163_15340 [Planctomycetes bacterium Pla163]|uniref:DUF1844 domain-containing protein n=1 Tax=Rohdeia mirabilis TaxID=2528008 RepID=A0A518CYY2_9BACT|nr:hypothetical protein Pla163_15340 [Planctomycetes bacterium Pla163]